MKPALLVAILLASGPCSPPQPLTATVSAVASDKAKVGESVQLVIKVTNTGPLIPHLGLVFRSEDRWFERHQVTDFAGCAVASEQSAFDCGNLNAGDSRSFAFQGVATTAGAFHYELALRELVQPFEWVNDHADGADAQTWDETVS